MVIIMSVITYFVLKSIKSILFIILVFRFIFSTRELCIVKKIHIRYPIKWGYNSNNLIFQESETKSEISIFRIK